jgi:CRISPR-associated protein Csb2
MSLIISIRFLAGRAHLHPWQTHHSEGRVDWPPSPWRLLRAIVAVAGRGLTSLPAPDWFVDPGKKPRATKKGSQPVWPPPGYCSLPDEWNRDGCDEIPLSQLTALLAAITTTPAIWLPRTSGGHTRQYFPIHNAGVVRNTGSAVFDTFATIAKDQPLLFQWPEVSLDEQHQLDLKLLLGRMTYFGRAESWSRAQAHMTAPDQIDGVVTEGRTQTHWCCVCIEDRGNPGGKEYHEYTLERRLAPVKDIDIQAEAVALLPRTKNAEGSDRKAAAQTFESIIQSESPDKLLLRCLLRESGQDIKDGLERPIGTRWIHYAVPRAIYDVPRPTPQPLPRTQESVNLVRYALNTATVNRPVLPPVTDTLLVADRFRNALMALHREPSRNFSGHESDGAPGVGKRHASWWPFDEDGDGFIDHVMVWAPDGLEVAEVDALRRLTRLRQRGGRPDLLVTPTFVGQDSKYVPWLPKSSGNGSSGLVTTFVSATPYFCPIHLSHGRGKSGRLRPVTPELVKGLKIHGVITAEEEVQTIQEIVFDYAPAELAAIRAAIAKQHLAEPVPPRQFFPVVDVPKQFPPLPVIDWADHLSFLGASLKNPDGGFPFGLSVGLTVDNGTRFIRAASFCRRRRHYQVKGFGRMFRVEFHEPREPRPFAIGDQCHYGLGLFVPGEVSSA